MGGIVACQICRPKGVCDVRYGSIRDIRALLCNVCFAPNSGHPSRLTLDDACRFAFGGFWPTRQKDGNPLDAKWLWWPAMALFDQTVRPVGQAAIGKNVVGLTIALCVFIVLWSDASIGQPGGLDDIYTTRAVVTGKDERNRPLGFKLCFEDVIVKVSGDASILSDRRLEALAAVAGQYVSTFHYRDRFEGKPVHDEQGTYDRPHFLTCQFDPQKIDGVLKMLGRKPWLAHRPRLVMVLRVHGRTISGLLSSDGSFDPDMREALANSNSALRSDAQSTKCRYARRQSD